MNALKKNNPRVQHGSRRRPTRVHPVVKPTPEDEAALDATKAPLMEHLLELRTRLIWAVVSFLICFVICFFFARPIFTFLTRPLHAALAGQANDHLIYTALTEVFFTNVKIGAFGGLCLGFPAIAAQIWIFVAPGLYRHEKQAFWPFLLGTPVMFILGAAFVYYLMLPLAIKFFTGFQTMGTADAMGIQLQAKVSDYLDLVMTLIFAFGLTFQLPVVLTLLAKVGIVGRQGAARHAPLCHCRPVRPGRDFHPARRLLDAQPGGTAGRAL